jgi:PAS domain S-box-containing protein
VLLLREDGTVRVVASHGLAPRQLAAFAGFAASGSALIPSESEPAFGRFMERGDGQGDLLAHLLAESGLSSHASLPLAIDGRPAEAVLCLVARASVMLRHDTRHRLMRAGSRIADSLERRRRADEVARREASLRAIVDSVAEGIVTIDGTGRILSANPAIGRILGYTTDELIGMQLPALMPERDRERHACGFARYMAGGERRIIGRQLEVAALRKDGSEVAVELVVSEIEPRRLFTGVMRDITERKLADSRLRQSDRMASLGALAAGLGHDMNNVLFPIRAHLNALAQEASAGRSAAPGEHVDQIGQGVRYLQQLADGLHYLVHDAGHADGGCDGAVLADWWRGTGPLLSRSLPPLCEVEADIADGLPRVRATEHALTQAVLNLFVNAGEAIASVPGSPRGRVRIAAHAAPDGRSILLSVTDNGPGMSEDTKRRAFDMFFTTKVRGMGTGLGLAMVNRVVREAGGEAHIESAPGKGVTITLRIPVAVDPGASAGAVAAITSLDGRAAGFVESALGGRGMGCVAEPAVEGADAWFVDPRAGDPRAVRAWKRRRAGRTVVLLGAPHRRSTAAWSAAADCTIDSVTDFDTLLVGVDRACSIIQRRRNDAGLDDDGGAGAAGADARPQEGRQRDDRRRRGRGARAGGG